MPAFSNDQVVLVFMPLVQSWTRNFCESGCVHLPSQRKLRDYTHCVRSQTGFLAGVDKQPMGAANLPSHRSWERLMILLLDEMYVHEDLVYVKRTGKLVGFTSLD